MGEVQTLEQFREWIRCQCRKDVDPQWADNMVTEFEKAIQADAIPRAAVQAAVDEMKRRYQHGENCINGEDGSCEGCNLYRFQFPHCKSFACIERFTGVTPSEVK
jgi:hypothetical protein